MLTKEEIQKRAQQLKEQGDAPLFVGGWIEGATWANEQNAGRIAEIEVKLKTTLESVSIQGDTITQSLNRIAELETEIKDLRFRNEGDALLLQAKNKTIEKERAKVGKILTALRDLYDEQNGAPLATREEHWFQSYRKAGEILNELESNA